MVGAQLNAQKHQSFEKTSDRFQLKSHEDTEANKFGNRAFRARNS